MAFIRHHMVRGNPQPFFPVLRPRRKRVSQRQLLLQAALERSRRRQGPMGLGGRIRALAAAGDPFRFRLPKLKNLFKVPKGLKNIVRGALPVIGSAVLPGIGTALGSLAANLTNFGQGQPDTQSGSTLTGPGAPGQDYHEQSPPPSMPTRYQDQGAGPGVPVVEGTEVSADESLTESDDTTGGTDLDAVAQALEDSGVDTTGMTDDELMTVANMLTQ